MSLSLDKEFTRDGTAPGPTARINNGKWIIFGAGVNDQGKVLQLAVSIME